MCNLLYFVKKYIYVYPDTLKKAQGRLLKLNVFTSGIPLKTAIII